MSGPGEISAEPPQQCDICGVVAELRPYGPNGECVCFKCGMKNEGAAMKAFSRRVIQEENPTPSVQSPGEAAE